MTQQLQRRDFLRATGLCGTATLLPWFGAAPIGAAAQKTGTSKFSYTNQLGWQLSVAQYVFRRFSLYETLPMLQSLGIRHVEPAYFLKLDKERPKLKVNESLSPAERKQLKTRLAEYGIRMDSYYTNLTSDKAACQATYEFAKQMGVKTLVAEPAFESLDMLEQLCNQYDINLAIHNHPKPRSKYWNPDTVVRVCKGRGKRIGACCDVGHWARTGLDVVASLRKLQGRIIELHLKDIVDVGNPDARDVPLGQGKADIAGVLRELRRQKFRGLLVVEYEYDSPKLMDQVAQCVAYVEKTAQTIK